MRQAQRDRRSGMCGSAAQGARRGHTATVLPAADSGPDTTRRQRPGRRSSPAHRTPRCERATPRFAGETVGRGGSPEGCAGPHPRPAPHACTSLGQKNGDGVREKDGQVSTVHLTFGAARCRGPPSTSPSQPADRGHAAPRARRRARRGHFGCAEVTTTCPSTDSVRVAAVRSSNDGLARAHKRISRAARTALAKGTLLSLWECGSDNDVPLGARGLVGARGWPPDERIVVTRSTCHSGREGDDRVPLEEAARWKRARKCVEARGVCVNAR